jgi:hypothetical protein
MTRPIGQTQRWIARAAEFLTDCSGGRSSGQGSKSENLTSSRRLMSDRMEFEIVCPNDHNQTVTFSREEFEAELKSGALLFHCNTCDTDWPPSSEEIAKFRQQFVGERR